MTSYFEIEYIKRTAKVNYLILTLYLAVSVTAHAIATRLVSIHGIPIISAGFIYMAVFVLTDVLATYNSRRLVILMIFLESFFNLFFVLYTNIISNMPAPEYFTGIESYKAVFSPTITLYAANLLGTIVSAIVDLFIFFHLYLKKKWIFLTSSFCSSIITITCYTYLTDYFGFRQSYPDHVFELTFINLLTNFITLLIYSVAGQILVSMIDSYICQKSKKILYYT